MKRRKPLPHHVRTNFLLCFRAKKFRIRDQVFPEIRKTRIFGYYLTTLAKNHYICSGKATNLYTEATWFGYVYNLSPPNYFFNYSWQNIMDKNLQIQLRKLREI